MDFVALNFLELDQVKFLLSLVLTTLHEFQLVEFLSFPQGFEGSEI